MSHSATWFCHTSIGFSYLKIFNLGPWHLRCVKAVDTRLRLYVLHLSGQSSTKEIILDYSPSSSPEKFILLKILLDLLITAGQP